MATELALTGAQARELESHTDAVQKLQDEDQTHAVKTALQLGEHLLAMRGMFDTGAAFVEYVLEHCGYSKSTAYNYIAAFEVFGKAKHVELFEDSAMYLLAKDSTPEAAYEQAMKLASGGTRITKAKAQEIIDKVLAKSKAMQEKDDFRPTELENDTQQEGEEEPDDESEPDEPQEPVANQLAGKVPEPEDDPDDPTDISEPEPKPADPNELGELRENILDCYALWTEGTPPHVKVFVDETLKELMSQ